MPPTIHWFRRDLRLRDNPALAAAAGAVIPLFILDDTILHADRTAAARVSFLLESLRALDAELRARGSRLVLRRGPSLDVLAQILRQSGATAVHWNRDYTPFATRRDAAAEVLVRAHGAEPRSFKDAVIYEATELQTGAGKPYTVYTPYRRKWRAAVEQHRTALLAELAPLRLTPVPDQISSEPIPTAAELGIRVDQQLPPAGEAAGLRRLHAFVGTGQGGIAGYDTGRDLPAESGTSRLSAYLRLGCVGPLTALRAALAAQDAAQTPEQRAGAETWIGELAWRDFYYAILASFPHVLQHSFKPQYDGLQWENDQELFAAWCAGRTGYPIVDAAMRQLAQEAWMHNRARMIVASFLTKDLLVDWRWGERFFMQQLVDGDHASNNGGWQWAASTGTDAQPYFRIFNPVSQGQKFDPDGAYVRRYVPELAGVPDKYIHTPWLMPTAEQRAAKVDLGKTYPLPVVDHAIQREKALNMFKVQGSKFKV